MICLESFIYSSLNTFIQFMAAIYVTIALDVVFFNRFWTPDIFKTTISVLKRYKLEKPAFFENKFKEDLEDRFTSLESITRKRGFFNVCLCLFLLLYNVLLSLNSFSLQYPFIIYIISFILADIILFFARWFFKRRWMLCLSLLGYFTILAFAIKYINRETIPSPAINGLSDSTKILIIAGLLVTPILYQLFLTWMYSKGYTQYLSQHIAHEAAIYEQAKKALVQHDDKLIPEEYRSCFATTVQSRTSDIQMTNIEQQLYEVLKGICCKFSLWDIFRKLDFKDSLKYHDTNVTRLDDEDETIEKTECYEYLPNEIDYAQRVKEYKHLNPIPTMQKYCKDNKLELGKFKKAYSDSHKK